MQEITTSANHSVASGMALTEQECQKILVDWNNTAVAYPNQLCIHQLFAIQAAQTPQQIAVVFQEEHLTYQQLNERANQLAHYLQSLGIQRDDLVGLCVDRSIDMIVGMLGILKAGGAYVPLDPGYPEERLSFMLADSQVQVLLTQEKFVTSFQASGIQVVCLDRDGRSIKLHRSENPISHVTAENLAYVIYTSGSTGTPKGVAILHRAVNRLVCNANYIEFVSSDRVAQVSSTSFDAATFEVWGALLHGAALVIIPQTILLAPHLFAACLEEQNISILFLTTALFNQVAQSTPHAFQNLRYLLFGGEAANVKCVQCVWQQGRPQHLLHVYGPTESTTFAAWYPVADVTTDATTLPIGRPISNTQLYVLDAERHPVPIGTPGELYIGGDGLARGYLNRPDLTAAKFIPDPLGQPSERYLYQTGDLVRWLSDGNIEFLGRVDHQVKIRGFRVELGEIETRLMQHPSVQQAVVIVREDIPGDRRLVAYIVAAAVTNGVADRTADALATTLKRNLQAQLPGYMVPAAFVQLDALPLTPNGKVDRHHLPAPDRTRPALATTFVAPRHLIEVTLAEIWAQLLGLQQIGIHDDFFQLGGHSLIATQILSRIRDGFQVSLTFQQFFENPTIAGLTTLIQQTHPAQPSQPRSAIQPTSRQGRLPVSFAQERVYFIQQLAPDSSAYQFQATMRFRGHLDIPVLHRCLDEIVQHHEIFRTTYPAIRGQLFPVIHPHEPISFTVIDLTTVPASEQEAVVQQQIDAEVQKPLRMDQLPLIRWVLLTLTDRDQILVHIEHHMVHDGWSFNVFLDELLTLYRTFSLGQPSPFAQPTLQFVDFAQWQRDWVNSQEAQVQLSYWQQTLAGSPALLELPYDRPRPSEQTYNGDQIRWELPLELCESLRELSRQSGVTLFMTMLAAFQVLLYRYTGQVDLCVGTAVANRRMPDVESLIGMIVNNLVLRSDLSGHPTFRELLQRIRKTTLEAYAHEDLPFDKVVEGLKPVRNLSYNPLFQVMFSFHNSAMPDLQLPGLDISLHEPISNKSAKFDLDFLVIPRAEQRLQKGIKSGPKGITLVLEYNSDLFDATTIDRMLATYQTILTSIVTDPMQQIDGLPLLSPHQLQLLRQWSQTEQLVPNRISIQSAFEAQVARSPDAIALEQEDQRLTYRELNEQVNQLAHHLRDLGVQPETLVGLCVERSLEMVIGLLGILKAGGAYVPIDPAYPQDRIAEILRDTQLNVLLTQNQFHNKFLKLSQSHSLTYTGKLICLDTDWSIIASCSTANPVCQIRPDHLAYLIYTSGSTGKPKGVMLEHRSLMNFVTAAIETYGLQATDRILQFASFCFDASIEEIFPCVAVGATLVLRTDAMLHSSDQFWRCCDQWQLTVLDLPTAYWHQLVADLTSTDSRIPISLKTVIIGGEEAQPEKINHWHRCLAHWSRPPALFNSYGPTEATVVTTISRLTAPTTTVTLGRPIHNTQVYILDAHHQAVPIGVSGELYIGGAGLARGYWQRPELTAEKFIDVAVADLDSKRLYKTGDRARFRTDGTLEYLGRVDDQVKIRGFRIELGEIEAVLHQQEQVEQAIVVAREDVPGQKRLVAYVVPQGAPTPHSASDLLVQSLQQSLQQRLPNYMVPSVIVLLDTLPLTANRKVDYQNLPAPAVLQRTNDHTTVAPRTAIEATLVKLWADLLHLEQVSIHDNYFELGGDSILSIQLISRANQAGIHITPKQIFQHQTIAELASVVRTTRHIIAEQGGVTGEAHLTPIQHWFFEQHLSEPDYFNQSVLLEVPSDLQIDRLQQSIQQVFEHHDALRLRFKPIGTQSLALAVDSWYAEEVAFPLKIIDLSHLAGAEQQTALQQGVATLQASLQLSTGPIAQVALFQLGSDQLGQKQPDRLLVIVHHLAIDAVSWRILLEDLATAYQQSHQGEPIQLPAKTTSWQYWSDRLTEYAQSTALLTELDYWLTQSGKHITPFPIDAPQQSPNNTVTSTAWISVSLSTEETRTLIQDIPAIYKTQINDVLLTAVVQSFTQWSGQDSLWLDLEGHGREDLFEDVDLSRTIGWFTTLFPVQLQITHLDDPGHALRSMKEQLRRIPHHGISYGIGRYLSQDQTLRQKLANLPQPQVSFNYLGQFDPVVAAAPGFGLMREFKAAQSLLNQRSHLVGISGLIRAGQLEMTWAYNQVAHQRATMQRWADCFIEALHTLITHCRSLDAPGFTPSDFSAAKLNQQQLDKFLSKISQSKPSQPKNMRPR